jgi:hypothetical protein
MPIDKTMKVIGFASAILAFALCTAAGIWMLFSTGFTLDLNVYRNDPLRLGLALYFMGKGIFVGCMLMFTTLQFSSAGKSQNSSP